jgi:hypothetical protein
VNSWAITLDKWFLFVAGQIKDRAALRWLYQHRQQITGVWFWAAAVCSVFYILLFFGVLDGARDSQVMRELMQAATLGLFGGLVGDFSLVLMCFGLGAITPVLIALIPGAFKQTTPKSHRIFFKAISGVALNQFRASQF